jgi:chromosome segregation ATPase
MTALITQAKAERDSAIASMTEAQNELKSSNANYEVASQKLSDAQTQLTKALADLASAQNMAEQYGERLQNDDEFYALYDDMATQMIQTLGLPNNATDSDIENKVAEITTTTKALQKEIDGYKAQITWLKIERWIFGVVGLLLGAGIMYGLKKLFPVLPW